MLRNVNSGVKLSFITSKKEKIGALTAVGNHLSYQLNFNVDECLILHQSYIPVDLHQVITDA
jgi:hypothetical protein